MCGLLLAVCCELLYAGFCFVVLLGCRLLLVVYCLQLAARDSLFVVACCVVCVVC